MALGQETLRSREDTKGSQHHSADRLGVDDGIEYSPAKCTVDASAISTLRSHRLCPLRSLLSHIFVIDADREGALIETLAAVDHTTVVSFFNQYAFNLAYSDAEFRQVLQDADVLLRDGVGVELMLKLLGVEAGKNMNGTDLIPRLLLSSKGKSVAIFGTREPWLGKAASALQAAGLYVTTSIDGFQPEEAYLASVKASDPDIIILGMGMPRQEKLAATLARVPGGPRLIVNGGAILDFYAGRFKRAPQWVRHRRLEWLFRLLQEPRRLADRYFRGGVLFIWRILRLAIGGQLRRPPAPTSDFRASVADKKAAD